MRYSIITNILFLLTMVSTSLGVPVERKEGEPMDIPRSQKDNNYLSFTPMVNLKIGYKYNSSFHFSLIVSPAFLY